MRKKDLNILAICWWTSRPQNSVEYIHTMAPCFHAKLSMELLYVFGLDDSVYKSWNEYKISYTTLPPFLPYFLVRFTWQERTKAVSNPLLVCVFHIIFSFLSKTCDSSYSMIWLTWFFWGCMLDLCFFKSHSIVF